MRLDQLPLRRPGRIVSVDWAALGTAAARRLLEMGFDEGVTVEALHRGPFGLDPIACRVGRMTVALRSALAAKISVDPA